MSLLHGIKSLNNLGISAKAYELDDRRLVFRYLAWTRYTPVKVGSGLYPGPYVTDCRKKNSRSIKLTTVLLLVPTM